MRKTFNLFLRWALRIWAHAYCACFPIYSSSMTCPVTHWKRKVIIVELICFPTTSHPPVSTPHFLSSSVTWEEGCLLLSKDNTQTCILNLASTWQLRFLFSNNSHSPPPATSLSLQHQSHHLITTLSFLPSSPYPQHISVPVHTILLNCFLHHPPHANVYP